MHAPNKILGAIASIAIECGRISQPSSPSTVTTRQSSHHTAPSPLHTARSKIHLPIVLLYPSNSEAHQHSYSQPASRAKKAHPPSEPNFNDLPRSPSRFLLREHRESRIALPLLQPACRRKLLALRGDQHLPTCPCRPQIYLRFASHA